MRSFANRVGWLLLSLAPLSCGGNWSNRDLEFLISLPRREELAAEIPSNSSSSGLRQDALSVGDPSTKYVETKRAVEGFNQHLDDLLVFLDSLRKVPPTSRQGNERIWGPVVDKNNPGFELRVVIDQMGDLEFQYSLEFRRSPNGVVWFPVLSGTAVGTHQVGRGHGQLSFSNQLAGENGLMFVLQPTTVTLEYQTDVDPRRTHLSAVSGDTRAEYRTARYENGAGSLEFLLEGDLVLGPATETLQVTSGWLASGAGRSDGVVLSGDGQGQQMTECWDQRFLVTYLLKTWDGLPELGSLLGCPQLPAL